jgi:hypothetical protein
MKRSIAVLAAIIMVLAIIPVMAVDIGTGIGVDIQTEKFKPLVWMCDHRTVVDDNVEPGRISEGGDLLIERVENYAFEGEQIHWEVLVMDKNGIEKIKDVFMTVGDSQGTGNEIQANCKLHHVLVPGEQIGQSCRARIGEEWINQATENTMAYYDCTLTVETPESMHGEYWVTVEVEDLDGLSSIMAENEYWFFNPEIALLIQGGLAFDEVRPGSDAYSETLTVGNDAEAGSGVLLDMFVSGTDFYDSSSSGAKCPTTNQLALDSFAYNAVNGAYGSQYDPRRDAEGYVGICYGDKFQTSMYNECEIVQGPSITDGYYAGNVLTPGAEISMTFRLSLPEPCNGDFDSGQIFFWAEAI